MTLEEVATRFNGKKEYIVRLIRKETPTDSEAFYFYANNYADALATSAYLIADYFDGNNQDLDFTPFECNGAIIGFYIAHRGHEKSRIAIVGEE